MEEPRALETQIIIDEDAWIFGTMQWSVNSAVYITFNANIYYNDLQDFLDVYHCISFLHSFYAVEI